MIKLVVLAALSVSVIPTYGVVQVQMPEASELHDEEHDFQAQIRELQKNMTDIWTYIYELRNVVSGHLKHIRVHQEELESFVQKMEHLHDGVVESSSHSDSHHHSGNSHGRDYSNDDAHGSDHHSHSDDHTHGSDDHSHGSDLHSHSDDHTHGSDFHSHRSGHQSHSDDHSHDTDHHSHGSDHHSESEDHSHDSDHGSDHHGHSGEHHIHSDEHGHYSHSESHSHTSHDHSKEDHHSHRNDNHKDSQETEDFSQQTQQAVSDFEPIVEPIIVASNANQHGHHGRSASNRMDLVDKHRFHRHCPGYHYCYQHHHSRSKIKTDIPKYADYNLYNFAYCTMFPNRAIPEEQQQNVTGSIAFWQKKSGGPLNIAINIEGFKIRDHDYRGAHQAILSSMTNNVEAGGHKHGFHIHARGDLSNGCENVGPHYNPKNVNHGGPHATTRHVGDLGNIECDEHGVSHIIFSDEVASLSGQYSIIGKAAVIHANPDDLGLGGNPESLNTGNAGTRIACCVIQPKQKLSIRYYKFMEEASQYNN